MVSIIKMRKKKINFTFPKLLKSGFSLKALIYSLVSKLFPKVLITYASASKFVLAGNNGFPLSSSGIMHPRAQISIDLSYDLDPTKSSGARYHLVETYSVKFFSLSTKYRACPRSHTFKM